MKNLFFSFLCTVILIASQGAYATPKQVIIDTDANGDDAIAILYLLNNKDIRVNAIIVDRNGGCNPNTAAGHIGSLLQLTNQQDIPVYIGIKKEPVYQNVYPDWLYELVDKSYGNNGISPEHVLTEKELVKLIMSQPQPQLLLSLGSLTNIADLFQKYPDIKSKIANITIMGGAVDTKGNIQSLEPKNNNSYAEWNVFVDPVAFEQVLQSQLPITLVSLDITDKVLVTMSFMNELKQNQHSGASKLAYHLLEQNILFIKNKTYDFWDPLAAYVLAHPEQVQTEPKRIQTVLTYSQHFGQLTETDLGYPVNLVTYVNQKAFEQSLLKGLNSGS